MVITTLNEVRQIFEQFDPNKEIVVSKGKLGMKSQSQSLISRKGELISKAAAEKILHVAAESYDTMKEIKDFAGFKALREKLIKECNSGKFSINTFKVTAFFQQVFGEFKVINCEKLILNEEAAKFVNNPEYEFSYEFPAATKELVQLDRAFGVAGAAYQIDDAVLKVMQRNSKELLYIDEFFPKGTEVKSHNTKGLQERVFDFMQTFADQRIQLSKRAGLTKLRDAKETEQKSVMEKVKVLQKSCREVVKGLKNQKDYLVENLDNLVDEYESKELHEKVAGFVKESAKLLSLQNQIKDLSQQQPAAKKYDLAREKVCKNLTKLLMVSHDIYDYAPEARKSLPTEITRYHLQHGGNVQISNKLNMITNFQVKKIAKDIFRDLVIPHGHKVKGAKEHKPTDEAKYLKRLANVRGAREGGSSLKKESFDLSEKRKTSVSPLKGKKPISPLRKKTIITRIQDRQEIHQEIHDEEHLAEAALYFLDGTVPSFIK